ncbi:hypothetical protein [Bacillus cereus]|uniref:hypothetical protein n=1 Tax=Bacillus cereus TaxID=1396 RepID=UPI000BF6EB11|nr:hypothetical protein [Bacillus cereus]PFL43538.1 hypothetical protein COJ06_02305 [Bacillus cereus]PGQ65027.1 hypothetical protein COA27_29020 [Bacillus cereus]
MARSKKRSGKRKGHAIPNSNKKEIVIEKNSPYTLTYLLNGKPERKAINEKDFYDANERALEILKSVKDLQGKFHKRMTISLHDNEKNKEYRLKWKKHSPLSGVGGYFTTFEINSKVVKEEEVKSSTHIINKYGLTFAVFVLGFVIILISWFLKEADFLREDFVKQEILSNKYIWLLLTLLYGAILPVAKGEGMKSVKGRGDIFCYTFILDSPIWLGAIMTMGVFYDDKAFGDNIWINIGAGLIVFILLVGRLWLNYKLEEEKYYKENLPSLNNQ